MTSIDTLKKLYSHQTLLDILLEIESFFDSFHLYAYKNWFDGVVVEGPQVQKYWITIQLMYPYEKMPDPKGAAALAKHGIKVRYKKGKHAYASEVSDNDFNKERKPKMKKCDVWLVTIKMPRRFVDDFNKEDLQQYDDDLNIDDVTDAQAKGYDDDAIRGDDA